MCPIKLFFLSFLFCDCCHISSCDLQQDSNGRRLYVNHSHRRASLRHPREFHRRHSQDNITASNAAATTTQEGRQPGPVGWAVTGAEGAATVELPGQGSQGMSPRLPMPRQFLIRSHSVDVMEEQPGQLEESGSDESPPNAEEVSVLRPLANLSLHDQRSQQQNIPSGASGSGGGAFGGSVASTSQGDSSYAPPQLSTALQRAVSTLYPTFLVLSLCFFNDSHELVRQRENVGKGEEVGGTLEFPVTPPPIRTVW